MRSISRTSVVLVVLHLPSLAQLAASIYEQIIASLGAFLLNTAAICSPFTLGVTEEDEAGLMKQFVLHSWTVRNVRADRTLRAGYFRTLTITLPSSLSRSLTLAGAGGADPVFTRSRPPRVSF